MAPERSSGAGNLRLTELIDRCQAALKGLAAFFRKRGGPRPAKRAKVPTVLQMEAVECGAASLAMILAHFGLRVPLEELRVACGVSRDGSKASNVLKAARTYGLIAKGFRKEPDDLRTLAGPMVIHWNFNHFLVLEGFGRKGVFLNDPAQGPVKVSGEEFNDAFTGVAMTFEPGPEFRPGGKKRSLMAALAPRLAGSWLGLFYVFLAGFALLVPGLVIPTFSRVFVDDILVRGLGSWLRWLLAFMALAAFVQIALTWIRQHYLLRLETKLTLSTSAKFFWHVLRLPVEFYNQRYAGEVGNRVTINDRVAGLLSGQLATTLLNLVVIGFYALLMIQYDVLLTVVSVAIAVLNLVVLKLISRKRVDLNQRLLKEQGSVMGVAMGGLQTIETLRATGSEPSFFSRWSGHMAKAVNSGQQLALANQVLTLVPPLLLAINTAVLLGLGGSRVMDGHLTMGMLIAYQALMLTFLQPVNQMVSLGGKLQDVEGDLNRLDDVLVAKVDRTVAVTEAPDVPAADPEDRSETDGMVKLAGYLELRDISFGYSLLDPPLIDDFHLRLTPGSRIALVGGSGSGKSTISKLVAGLYEPWGGEILFDGKQRHEIPRGVITSSIAFVDQDIFLFEGTAHENLVLWDSTIPEADVVRAAQDAAIHDDLAARPKGLASPVSEGGTNFSGGQRQRLEIARALALNPTILVLDEATSALDPTTERIIDDKLRQRGVTCLIVAHRLSTIRDCDEIIVMDRGKIVERGTHDELVEAGGSYHHLISAE